MLRCSKFSSLEPQTIVETLIARTHMLSELQKRYAAPLDEFLRTVVSSIKPEELNLMQCYAFGWVDEIGQPMQNMSGKRLRPYLLLLCCEAAGGDWQRAIPAAAAVELLHNFSLVHDDIQDQSTMRHNRPSIWARWGQAKAINVGDSLLGLAFHTLHELRDSSSPETVLAACQDLNGALRELTRGQHLDLQFEKMITVDEDEYISMIEGKTAALFATSAKMGARLAQHRQHDQFAEFGRCLGIAFQIRDDILGIWGESDAMGKSSADDIRNRKKSLPNIRGMQREPDFARLFQQETLSDAEVDRARILLNRCGARPYAEAVEKQFGNAAIQAISAIEMDPVAGNWLKNLPADLLGRAL